MLANILPWRARPLEFIEPRLDDSEWERERLGLIHHRPLLWTAAPPTTPGLYFCRFPGTKEFEVIRVDEGVEFGLGLEWSSAPITVPYEPGMPRRVRRP